MTSLRELKSTTVSSVIGKRGRLNPARRNQFGETPLHTACIAGNISLVEQLIEERVPLNPKDNCGWTPLHEACNHGHLEVVEVLLKAGAFVDAVDERSELLTPLHDACENGHIGIARLLLKYGADVCALNGKHETPVERLMARRVKEGKELSKEDLADSVHLEKEMLGKMAEAGFNLDLLRRKIVNSSSNNKANNSDGTQSDSKSKRLRNFTGGHIYDDDEVAENEKTDDSQEDIDEPGRGRLEYLNAIDKVGRRTAKGAMPARLAKLAARKNRTKEVSALIAENEEAPRDDWLIDDLGIFTKKRGSREDRQADSIPSPKKRRYSVDSAEERRLPAVAKASSRKAVSGLDDDDDAFIASSDDDSVTEDFNCNYVNNFEEDNIESSQKEGDRLTTTIEVASSPVECSSELDQAESSPTSIISKVDHHHQPTATNNDNYFSKIIIVQFDDAERSSFAIPLPASSITSTSSQLTFEWLSTELVKRYYRKFSVKPVISLYTTEGAIISAEDLVVDMIRCIGGEKPVFKAKIESYTTEDPTKRFQELCKENGEEVIYQELLDTLSSLKVSSSFNVSNSFLGADRQNQLMFQSLYRQELKEIDVSFSNVLLHRKTLDAFFTALSSIPTLQVLNLSGTAFPPKLLMSLVNFSPALRHLDLSFNSFADENAYAVAQIINVYDRLVRLNLSACGLRMSFLKNSTLIEAIEGASNLVSIDLDYNINIETSLVANFKSLNVSKQFLKTL